MNSTIYISNGSLGQLGPRNRPARLGSIRSWPNSRGRATSSAASSTVPSREASSLETPTGPEATPPPEPTTSTYMPLRIVSSMNTAPA